MHDHLHEREEVPRAGARPARPGPGGRVQAAMALQRAAGNQQVAQLLGEEEPSPVHAVLASGGGRPLDDGVRADMEGRLGADFSDVRIHTDAPAAESARAVNAHAYTVGNNVVFQRDAYDPSSDDGRRTLAHELVHVVQQRSGPVDGTPAPGGIALSDPSDPYEREATTTADAALQRQTPQEEEEDDLLA